MTFAAIIPLYNKGAEVARAVHSVLAQTLLPTEIIVIDDGSTDGGAEVVRRFNSPLIRLISQKNAGETAARNRGMAEASARTTHFALLDADDEWRPRFLEAMGELIADFPDAGLYCTGFEVARGEGLTPGRTPSSNGEVDFFEQSMSRFVATASSSVISRAVVERVGGFPTGMRLGGDQYMWTKIALASPVVFTPERLAVVHASASNRSAAIYKPETTTHSFTDFLNAADGPNREAVREYVARVALGKAIAAVARGGTDEGRKAERDFAYNRRSGRLWWRLWLLNRLPRAWRPVLNGLYVRVAWIFFKKGY